MFATPVGGLSRDQVVERVAAGRTNRSRLRTSRSLLQIVRANVITPFNGLLATLFVLVMLTGRWQNGLFGLVIVANSAIGVVQEVRAKRTLDRLAVLTVPRARVVRDGAVADLPIENVVVDDLLELRTGDQVCADGVVTSSAGLEVDESLLTGESDPVAKDRDDRVLSGSIVVSGTARVQATGVGAEAYAAALATEARRFTLVRSELVGGVNTLLKWISLLMLVVGPVLLWSQFRSADNHGWQDALTGTVAALVGMVPEGLVLLTSLAFVVAALTLARRRALVQELPAVEVLARVDVVCLDKTGTLTDGEIAFDELIPLSGLPDPDVPAALALLCTGDDANATARALAPHFPDSCWEAADRVPFSSARKWSAVSVLDQETWVFGAPEMIFPASDEGCLRGIRERTDAIAAQGRRVLLLASTRAALDHGPVGAVLPAGLVPRALVVLAERLRADAADTMRFFTEQGVALKVISGDSARTVGAIAAAVGVPGVSGARDAVDGRTLPTDLDELADLLDQHNVFGRVTPHQKRAVIAALQRRGHVVAMTGDGVNDALALKDADIGIAMGNGSAATRAVAQLVLLDSRFARLPGVVAEGRRVIANIERAANLFLIKNVYSLVLATVIAITALAYPLAPIQLTLISTVSIGIPASVLALAPNSRRYVPGFLRRVLRFAIPIGIIIAAAAYTGYWIIRAIDPGAGVDGGRTVATLTVLIGAFWALVVVARPLTGWKLVLILAMAATVCIVVAVPAVATGLFLLHPTPTRVIVALAVGAVEALAIELVHRGSEALIGRRQRSKDC